MNFLEVILKKKRAQWTAADTWKVRGIVFLIGMALWLALAALIAIFSPYRSSVRSLGLPWITLVWAVVECIIILGVTSHPPKSNSQIEK